MPCHDERLEQAMRVFLTRRWVIGGTVLACLLNPLSAFAAKDTTPPTTPIVTDDGTYTASATQLHASWSSSDPQSQIAEYQYSIRQDSTAGTLIVNWTSTQTATAVTKTGLSLLQGKSYYFAARAKNGAGLWSAIGYSNGIKVDTTASTAVTVTDDGATTSSTTQLHATWTPSSDPTSGIADYQYQIRRDSPTGTIIRDWTSVGVVTQVTATGLSLVNGMIYYMNVRAKNNAGLFSIASASDGIKVQADTTPPTGTMSINSAATYATTTAVTLTLSAADNSGTVSQMQCSNDNVTYSTPEAYATTKSWTLTAGDGAKTVYVKFKDPAGNWSAAVSDSITLDATPPGVIYTSPQDGAMIGIQG